MARDGLHFVACAGLFLSAVVAVPAAPPDEAEARLRSQLAVQRALQQGRDCLKRGNYQAAVYVLENEISRVNGDRDYLLALRDAYRGYVRELLQAGRNDDARLYQGRLQYLDPGARLDTSKDSSAATVAAAQVQGEDVLASPAVTAGPESRAGQSKAAPPRRAASGGFEARGAMPDPFEDPKKNSNADGQTLVRRAAEEFGKGHYVAAGQLYGQAKLADPRKTDEIREQWAYCKLYGVVESLNHGDVPVNELKDQVRQALALTNAPKLEAYGKELLRRIEEGGKTQGAEPSHAVTEVRHSPAKAGGWAVAETTNFRVLHRHAPELAERVARAAEETRSAVSLKWFGDLPPAWTPRCDVVLHATGEDYSRETRAPRWSPGHSSMDRDRDSERVVLRRIDLRCDDPHLLDALLPHETTHVVLYGRFGRRDVPRWADEGIAVLTEPRPRVELHLKNLPRHRQDHTLFKVGDLIQMSEYPDARAVGPFYAGSVSLVEFLSSQPGGPRAFTRFLRDGLESGFEEAARRHYQIQGFAELQRRWEQHAFGDAATAQLSGKPAD
jgi:hypothetical protein